MRDFTLPSADDNGRARTPDRKEASDPLEGYEIESSSSGDGQDDGELVLEGRGNASPDPGAQHEASDNTSSHDAEPEPGGSVRDGSASMSESQHVGGHASSAVGSQSDDRLRERIARATREGGRRWKIPPTYSALSDPPGEDWRTVLSDDPFERLYLDRDQASSVSDDIVRQRARAVREFWEHLARLYQSGEGGIRATIQQAYGADDVALAGYARRAEEAGELLGTAHGRTEAVRKREGRLRTELLAQFENYVFEDHELSQGEAGRLLDRAEANGWSRQRAAAVLLDELAGREYTSEGGDAPDTDASDPVRELTESVWSKGGGSPEPIVGVSAPSIGATPEESIGRSLANLMLGGAITAAQMRALASEAVGAGAGEDETVTFVSRRLDEAGWEPAPGEMRADGDTIDALASVRWLSADQYEAAVRQRAIDARTELLDAARQTIRDKVLTRAESKRLLDTARLDREEAAGVVRQLLHEQAFRPARGRPRGHTEAERLTSVKWIVVDKKPVSGLLLLLGLALVGAIAWTTLANREDDGEAIPARTAVVNTELLDIHKRPPSAGGDGTVHGQVELGAELFVTGWTWTESDDRWLRVQYETSEGRVVEGWVSGSTEHVAFSAFESVSELEWNDGEVVIIDPPDDDAPPEDDIDRVIPPDENEGFNDEQARQERERRERERAERERRERERREREDDDPPPIDTNRIYESGFTSRASRLGSVPSVRSQPRGYDGTVRLAVVVERDGSLSEPECATSVSDSTCLAAKRAIRTVRFNPAQIGDTNVRSRSSLTVQFEAPPVPEPERTITGPVNGSGSASIGGGQFGLELQSATLDPSGSGTRLVLSARQTASGFSGSWIRAESIRPRVSVGGANRTGQMEGWPEREVSGSGSRSGQIVFSLPQPPSAYAGTRATLSFPFDGRASTDISFTLPR